MQDMGSAIVPIRLLGPIGIEPRTGLGGPKQKLLLALLAVRSGEVVPARSLIQALWPEQEPVDATQTLHVFVSKLRRALRVVEAAVVRRDAGYSLQVRTGSVDVRLFEGLVDAAQGHSDRPDEARQLLSDALGLWRGAPFGDLGDHPALRTETSRLRDVRLRAVEHRADLDLAAGRHDLLVADLRRITSEHPLVESMWARLMLALHRSGRRAEAIAVYDDVRRRLSDELGVDPARPLQRLHLMLLRDDPQLREEDLRGFAAASSHRPEPSVADPNSIAVLPFRVIGGSSDVDVLAVGLHNDLMTELSRLDRLTVIARTSVLGYTGTAKPVTAVARELGAATIVEGSLQGVANRFRLTVHLVDGRSGTQRWAVSYDDEVTAGNLFSVQRDLAHEIATRLSARLHVHPPDDRTSTHSIAAYRLAAAARAHFDLKTAAGLSAAVDGYRMATSEDQTYVDAWSGLANALVSMEAYGYGDRHVLLPEAQEAVHRALALDPEAPEAVTSLGVLHTAYQDAPRAMTELRRATRTRPGYADAYSWLTWVQLLTGRSDEGLTSAKRTVELDPRAPEAQAHLALALAATGDPSAGATAARSAHGLSPYGTAVFYEAICLCEAGEFAAAAELLDPLTRAAPNGSDAPWTGGGPHALHAIALAGAGHRDDAARVGAEVDTAATPFAGGLVALAFGDLDRATKAFRQVDRLTAWPCLALHHYHRDLWALIAGTPAHDRLMDVARRSWQLASDG